MQGITSTSTVVSNLIPATVYYYEVIAFNGSSPSASSTVINQVTSAAVPPGQVSGLALGVASSTTQVLTWNAVSGNVQNYTVQYKITGASSFTSITGITATNYTLTGLSAVTSYTYQVFATYYGASGSASSTVAGTTLTSAGTSGNSMVTIGGHPLQVLVDGVLKIVVA